MLPETDIAAAQEMAQRCHEAIRNEWIPHERSMTGKVLTVSIGLGTMAPAPEDDLLAFVEKVDRRLYQAKQKGRNVTVG